jgi:hypothetical protein
MTFDEWFRANYDDHAIRLSPDREFAQAAWDAGRQSCEPPIGFYRETHCLFCRRQHGHDPECADRLVTLKSNLDRAAAYVLGEKS